MHEHGVRGDYPAGEYIENKLDPRTGVTMFDQVCGTDRARKAFEKRFKVEDMIDIWTGEVDDFVKLAKPYFLY